MSDLTTAQKLIDGLYASGYQDARKERDYDPRGCEEWQAVVDLIEQQQARIAELEAQVQNYPMQPIVKDEHGTFRFEENPIVNWLANEVSDMNQIAIWAAKNNVPNKYKEQLAQMVGYSVSGYGTLSYVSDESYNRAVAALPQPLKEKDDEL